MGDVTESLSIIGAMEAAGKVVVNMLLHRVSLLLVWHPEHWSIQFNLQKTLEVVCLFSFLKSEETDSVTFGGKCQPHTLSTCVFKYWVLLWCLYQTTQYSFNFLKKSILSNMAYIKSISHESQLFECCQNLVGTVVWADGFLANYKICNKW